MVDSTKGVMRLCAALFDYRLYWLTFGNNALFLCDRLGESFHWSVEGETRRSYRLVPIINGDNKGGFSLFDDAGNSSLIIAYSQTGVSVVPRVVPCTDIYCTFGRIVPKNVNAGMRVIGEATASSLSTPIWYAAPSNDQSRPISSGSPVSPKQDDRY